MSAELFPEPEPEEPDGSGLGGDGQDGWEDEQFQQQGLFVTLPAEEVTLEGFAEGGRADTMAPGALLAGILAAVAGDEQDLSQLGDDQLIGVLSGVRRMESLYAWTKLAAMRELASRPRRQDYAADEISCAFTLSWMSVAGEIGYAEDVARRLPQCFAALRLGRLDPVQLRIIEEKTRILSDADAAVADAQLAGAAAGKTYGELRALAHRLVLKLDPDAVRKRKEAARRDANVRCFREESGNAGITGREMPSVEVLAAMQHISERARQLREAGIPGTLEDLKVRALLDLLREQDSRLLLDEMAGEDDPDAGDPADPGTPDSSQDGSGAGAGARDSACDDGDLFGDDPEADDPEADDPEDEDPEDGDSGDGGPGGRGGSGGPGSPGGPGGGGPGRAGAGPVLAALVNITIPYTIWHGDTGPPGEVGGFGILDHPDTRQAAAAAARSPDSRWCITLLDPVGTAAAHGCAPGPRHWPDGPPGFRTPQELAENLKIKNLDEVIRGPCDHSHEEDRYRPSRRLQHLIRARNATCTAPGCGRRAATCDLDHTDPRQEGGRTCECNLAPLCRHHHLCKHTEGWSLEQPEPGVLKWRTPAGRSYTTTPTQYAS